MGISAGRFRRRAGTRHPVHKARRTFGSHDDQIAYVRQFVRATLLRWGFDYHDMELVADELATNALVHGRSRFTVTLEESNGTLRLDVADGHRGMPFLATATIYSTRGRGLLIVAQVAKRWGTEVAESGGKKVWAELEVPRALVAIAGERHPGAPAHAHAHGNAHASRTAS